MDKDADLTAAAPRVKSRATNPEDLQKQIDAEEAKLAQLITKGGEGAGLAAKFQQQMIDGLKAELGRLTAALEGVTNEDNTNGQRTPALYQRIPPEAARASEGDGEGTLRSAAEVAATVYRPSESPSDGGSRHENQQREEFVLQRWARKAGLILPKGEFDREWKADGEKGGGEHDVYFSPDGKTVFKRNNVSFHSSYLEFFERLAIHNWLFPEAKQHLIGFDDVENPGSGVTPLQPVTRQDFIERQAVDTTGMTEAQAKAAQAAAEKKAVQAARRRMQQLGFKKYRLMPGDDPINEFWFHPETGTIVTDMHGENVVHTPKGDLAVFDPVIYTEPPKGSTEEKILTRDGVWPIAKPEGDGTTAETTEAARTHNLTPEEAALINPKDVRQGTVGRAPALIRDINVAGGAEAVLAKIGELSRCAAAFAVTGQEAGAAA